MPTPMPMAVLSDAVRPLDAGAAAELELELELVVRDADEAVELGLLVCDVGEVVALLVEMIWPFALTVLFVRLNHELPAKGLPSPGM